MEPSRKTLDLIRVDSEEAMREEPVIPKIGAKEREAVHRWTAQMIRRYIADQVGGDDER